MTRKSRTSAPSAGRNGTDDLRVRVLFVNFTEPHQGVRSDFLRDRNFIEVTFPIPAKDLLLQIQVSRPDVAIINIDVDPKGGLEAIEAVMCCEPIPLVVATRSASVTGDSPSMKALEAGALEVALLDGPEADLALKRQVALLSKVKVAKRLKRQSQPPAVDPPAPADAVPTVAIAASLGGPKALATLIAALPRDFPAAIVVCQHITSGFSEDLARYLAFETRFNVVQAAHNMPLVPKRCFVAPSDAHLRVVAPAVLKLDFSPPVGGFRPSCDVLLESVGQTMRSAAIGVVLTGMGRDGAKGLKEIFTQGGHTVAQDDATSVVFGMPAEAIALGGAEVVLPLEKIAPQLIHWVAQMQLNAKVGR
jgi:two-component system chemotaxis response regulator CheB